LSGNGSDCRSARTRMREEKTDAISPIVLDHASRPRNLGRVKDVDGHARLTGPCGDTMEFWLSVDDGTVRRASFVTDGCGASLACGSMATTLVEGKSITAAAALRPEEILEALGGLPLETTHCATLAANTLRATCEDYFMNHQKKHRTPVRKRR